MGIIVKYFVSLCMLFYSNYYVYLCAYIVMGDYLCVFMGIYVYFCEYIVMGNYFRLFLINV